MGTLRPAGCRTPRAPRSPVAHGPHGHPEGRARRRLRKPRRCPSTALRAARRESARSYAEAAGCGGSRAARPSACPHPGPRTQTRGPRRVPGICPPGSCLPVAAAAADSAGPCRHILVVSVAPRVVRRRERVYCSRHRLPKHQAVAWVVLEMIGAGQSQKSPVAGEGLERMRRWRPEQSAEHREQVAGG